MIKKIDEYEIDVYGLPVKIGIVRKDLEPFYEIGLPQFEAGTKALMENLKDRATANIEEGLSGEELLKSFREEVTGLVDSEMKGMDDKTKLAMVNDICYDATGLGPIQWILNDAKIEEIVLNGPNEELRVYQRKYGWLKTNIQVMSEAMIQNYSKKIGRDIGRDISILNPLLDARLASGDRANAILSPICDKGANITVRKFAASPWVFTDFIENSTLNYEVLALIWLAIQYEMNLLVSGGTASGKTSMLNVCMPFIPPNHRIVSIEDTRELQLPSFLYWTPLSTRQPNPEGKGEISMLDLLVNSLRMRPDRIVVGEIRRKEQAEILFEAMHTGHSVYSTVHANTCDQTFRRLLNEPIGVPLGMIEAVHLNVVMMRDRRRGIRRVYEVGELIPHYRGGESTYDVNIMYRWSPAKDEIVKNQDSMRLYEELSRHTSMTTKEIEADLREKEEVLKWAAANKLNDLEKVGELMNKYYREHSTLMATVKKKRVKKQ